MALFNRTFYDLNNERHYCFAVPDEKIPVAVLSDLKLSVPSYTDTPFISSVFIQKETVKVMIVSGGEIVASYSSESRSMLRTGRVYALKSWKKGYEGVLVFGSLKIDVHYKGDIPLNNLDDCVQK